MEEGDRSQGLGTPTEYAFAALTVVATVGFAFAFVFGPFVLALTRREPLWWAVAAAWLAVLGLGAARDRETRGWLAFALVGWIFLLPAGARALVRARRRG